MIPMGLVFPSLLLYGCVARTDVPGGGRVFDHHHQDFVLESHALLNEAEASEREAVLKQQAAEEKKRALELQAQAETLKREASEREVALKQQAAEEKKRAVELQQEAEALKREARAAALQRAEAEEKRHAQAQARL